MNSLFTRIFSTAIVLGAMALAPIAHADTQLSFNTMPGDQEFLTGRNVTQNAPAFGDPVSAVKADDIVDVAVYYHNADEDLDTNVAKNVHIQVTLPTTSDTTHVVTGSLSADNVPVVHGTIVNGVEVGQPDLTIVTTAATTMSMVPGSLRWYPDRMTTTGKGAALPNNQTGDTITTSGITIGDLRGCFQYSGFVIFSVKFQGVVVVPNKAILSLKKEVRLAGSSDVFVTKNTVTPGDTDEYRITVRNEDGKGIATSVILKDQLPDGMTYVGPTQLTRNNVVTTLPDGITTGNGIQIVPDLQPSEQVYVSFKAVSSNTFVNNQCVANTVGVTATNAELPPNKTADTCFSVKPVPTPTPTATPLPTPKPSAPTPTPPQQLPKTGPGLDFSTVLGFTGVAGSISRYAYLKKQVKKQARHISVL